MRDEMAEMDAKMERERERMEQQRAAEMASDQARQVYFQNRQAAAAAKARYDQEERGLDNQSRIRTGSTAAEVRRSAELQRLCFSLSEKRRPLASSKNRLKTKPGLEQLRLHGLRS